MPAKPYFTRLGFRINTLLLWGVFVLLFTLVPVSQAVAQTFCTPPDPAPSSLVSWWSGDGDATDIQGTNDGTMQNGATFAVGKVGQAFSFDAVAQDEFVRILDSPTFDLQSFTLDAWIKTSAGVFTRIVSQQDASANFWLMGVTAGGQLRFGTSLDGFIAGKGPVINDGQFHHVAVVRDTTSNVGQWYVDGVLAGTAPATSNASFSVANDVMIGRFDAGVSTGQFFDGLIDEVEVFNRALTAAEIKALFNAGSLGKCTGPLTVPPVSEQVIVELHTIDQLNKTGTTVVGIAGAKVKVYDREDAAFQAAYTKNPNGSLYPTIFAATTGLLANAACPDTDVNGISTCTEDAPGNYLVMVQFVDITGKTVTAGKPKSLDQFVDANADGIADPITDTNICSDTVTSVLDTNGDWTDANCDGVLDTGATKEFPILKVIRKTGAIQLGRGSKRVVRGSYLEIIYPEYAVWEAGVTSYVYPYIFSSDSAWSVNVCTEVPVGYRVVGVYDAAGNLVSSAKCVHSGVAGEKVVVAFEVADLQSPPPHVTARFTVQRKGKVAHFDLETPGYRKGKDNPGQGR